MNPASTRRAWKRLAAFYALCFLLLAFVPLAHAALVGGPLDFDAAGARASAATGLEWTSNLLVVLRLCVEEPVLWLIVFGSAVPSLAALLACAESTDRLRALASRLGPGVAWTRAGREYAMLSLLLVTAALATYGLRAVLPGHEYAWGPGASGGALLAAVLSAALLDQGAVLEELGWRGYAQHELQGLQWSPLAAAVCVGIAWGLWHVPRDVTYGVVERLGLATYLLAYLPAFVAGTVTTSIVAATFVNRCGGSVLPAILVHGLVNDSAGLSGMAAMDVTLSPAHQATKALPLALLALALLARHGRELGRATPPA